MKTLIKFFFLVACSFSLNAQQIPIEQYNQNNNDDINNAYFKDINGVLDKYVGTWEYNQNGHYFKIQFIKQTNVQQSPPISTSLIQRYYDRITARIEYKLNGVTIYNTLNQIGNSPNWYIRSYASSVRSNNKIWLHYKEPSNSPCGRKVDGTVNVEYSNTGGVETLTWSRTNRSIYPDCQNGQTADDTPFQIPANMVLTKVD